MTISMSPALRLFPPSALTEGRWVAEDIMQRRRFTVSARAAAALIASSQPRDRDQLICWLADAELQPGRVSEATVPNPIDISRDWAELVSQLESIGLILDTERIDRDPALRWLTELRSRWSPRGWHESLEYHALSFDYPCHDYTDGLGLLADRERMVGYQSQEPDIDRLKLDYADRPGISLPEPEPTALAGTAEQLWVHHRAPTSLTASHLRTVVSLGFGITGVIRPKTNSAPLIRRSSPSGGGRNPSEGYLVVLDVEGIDCGWYHITMEPFSLRRLDEGPRSRADLEVIFPDTLKRFPYRCRALLVVTCVFERNMYRYREPRTYRTVHMDAGHIASAVRLAARSLGLVAGIYYCDAATRFEQALGLDGMREGYMLTVAFADGQDSEAGGNREQAAS
jgi:SagB-type dehydrogenase family enzyme